MKEKIAQYMVGVGLVLFVVHNPYQPLLSYAFLPAVGLILLVFGALAILQRTKDWKALFGERRAWIPMALIALAIVGSGVEAWREDREEFSYVIGTACLALVLFSLYLASKASGGERIYKPFMFAVVVEAISIVVWGATHGWKPNGGLVSPTNWDIATGLIVFGILVSPKRHWWWLATIGAVGLLFSGSAEAMFIGAVMGIVAVVYRVKWWRVAVPVYVTLAMIMITAPIGVLSKVQSPSLDRIATIVEPAKTPANAESTTDFALGYRLSHWKLTMPIKPFGYGINITNFYWGIPHNVALIIVEQVGFLALVAWLWVAGRGIRRKEARVQWIGFVALGIFDHFIWTQAAPWFWCLAGTTSREEKEEQEYE